MSRALPDLSPETQAPEASSPPRAIAPAAVGRSTQPVVRPLRRDDLESVARLFLARFREPGASPRAAGRVADCMQQIYFEAPGTGGESDSLVHINARGEVGAFVGVMRVPFRLDGAPLLAAATGVLMSAPDAGNSLAAMQLLRALRRGPFDLVYTDSANRTSLALCQAMKYRALTPESLEWACIFQPAAVAAHRLSQRWRLFPARLARPFARAADLALSAAVSLARPAGKTSLHRDSPIDPEAFGDWSRQFLADIRLRPDWNSTEMSWLTARAAERESAGPLHFRLVADAANRPVGAYAFYGEQGGVARVLHACAAPDGWGALVAAMIETTRSLGFIGVHGAARRELMAQAYAVRGLIFYYAMGTLLLSPRPDVWAAIDGGSAFIGGLGGDRWTRLASDNFD